METPFALFQPGNMCCVWLGQQLMVLKEQGQNIMLCFPLAGHDFSEGIIMLARIYFFPDKIDLFFKIETRRQHTYIDIDLTLNQNNMGQKDTK